MKDSIAKFYQYNNEDARLLKPGGRLEFERLKRLIHPYLQSRSVILDVGGGTGRYSLWLAEMGHQVHLIEPAANLLQLAQKHNEGCAAKIASFSLGDARSLPVAESHADMIFLFGPIYHLTEKEERFKVLREALRALKPGGVVFALGISRFASLMDGLRKHWVKDKDFCDIVIEDLTSGFHRNITNHPAYFTEAYFHLPAELANEVALSGFKVERLVGVEGPAWLFSTLPELQENTDVWSTVLSYISKIEEEPSLLGASAHVLAIGRKEPNQEQTISRSGPVAAEPLCGPALEMPEF